MKLTFSKMIYDKVALLKTAYAFSECVYLHLEHNDTEWIVSWKPKRNETIDAASFENELITQQLRLELQRNSEDTRKILLARALASTIIEENQAFTSDISRSEQDEVNILKGWFDQHDDV